MMITKHPPTLLARRSYQAPPADLFSLGVTLLTAVTGQRCWSRADSSVDSTYKQFCVRQDLHTGPVFSRLPPDLVNFLTRSLAHSPADRLTIPEIRSHPWFRRGLARRLTPVAPPKPDDTCNPVLPSTDYSSEHSIALPPSLTPTQTPFMESVFRFAKHCSKAACLAIQLKRTGPRWWTVQNDGDLSISLSPSLVGLSSAVK